MDDFEKYVMKVTWVMTVVALIAWAVVSVVANTVSPPMPHTTACIMWVNNDTAVIKSEVPFVVNGTATEKLVIKGADAIPILMNASYIYDGREYKAVNYRSISGDLCDARMIIYLEP